MTAQSFENTVPSVETDEQRRSSYASCKNPDCDWSLPAGSVNAMSCRKHVLATGHDVARVFETVVTYYATYQKTKPKTE